MALAHPTITLLAIVATANHYLADAAVAGVLVVGVDAVLIVAARTARRRKVNVGAVNLPAGTSGRPGRKPRCTSRSRHRGSNVAETITITDDRTGKTVTATYHRRRLSGVGDS